MSGLAQLYGREIMRGAETAAEEINESGGIDGRQIEIVVGDDGSLPESAAITARQLVQEKQCQVLIGSVLSNSRISVVYQVCEPLSVPFLNYSPAEGSIDSPLYFNLSTVPSQSVVPLVKYLLQDRGPKFYLAGSEFEWSKGIAEEAAELIRGLGG